MNAMFEKRKDEDFVRDNITPKTNADRIRSMSDEELAEWILKHDTITYCHGRLNTEQLLEWLKSEVKE